MTLNQPAVGLPALETREVTENKECAVCWRFRRPSMFKGAPVETITRQNLDNQLVREETCRRSMVVYGMVVVNKGSSKHLCCKYEVIGEKLTQLDRDCS